MIWDGRIRADARALPIAGESVQCVVTSPPYWGLRDYGHDGQIGLERTIEEYTAVLVEVCREIRRVLMANGTLWLNLGDCYHSGDRGGYRNDAHRWEKSELQSRVRGNASSIMPNRLPQAGLKDKDLCMVPARVALALQADGWWLRSQIIWDKPNPMPSSVTDRPTQSHEYIYLLAKSQSYFYDQDAIKEHATFSAPNAPHKIKSPYGQGFSRKAKQNEGGRQYAGFNERWDEGEQGRPLLRNKRSVWRISTTPYPDAHYATFPEEIPEICIKAGSRPGDLVLDPFFGSGTVGRVAERLSRRWIGCDLGYQDLQAKRMANVQKELIV